MNIFKRIIIPLRSVLILLTCILLLQAFTQGSSGKQNQGNNDTTVRDTSLPKQFGFGRPATLAEIVAWDIDVRPDGKGLPAGSGNPIAGKIVYVQRCATCHNGSLQMAGSPLQGPALFITDSTASARVKTIGNYWPYATTLFDYIRRAMPYAAPGTLSDQKIYDVTAYLLYANKLIPEKFIADATTLPQVKMPALSRYVTDDRRGGPEIK